MDGAKPVQVLAVEDNRDDLTLLRHALLKLGVSVVTAENAEDGLRIARAVRPDLMLVDIGLPGMDGYSFVRECKSDPELQRIPAIALTGQEAAVANESTALSAGFDGFCVKTADSRSLERVIQALLRDDDRGQLLHRMLWRREMDDLAQRVVRLEDGQRLQGESISELNISVRSLDGSMRALQGTLGSVLSSLENVRSESRDWLTKVSASFSGYQHQADIKLALIGFVAVVTLAAVLLK